MSSWSQAATSASLRTYNGQRGYLATITSSIEVGLIGPLVSTSCRTLLCTAWIGSGPASASTSTATVWTAGPEAGLAVSFTAWCNGYPVAGGGAAYIDPIAAVPNGCWKNTAGNSATAFVVEYGPSFLGALQWSDDDSRSYTGSMAGPALITSNSTALVPANGWAVFPVPVSNSLAVELVTSVVCVNPQAPVFLATR
jgi:hypothetical protein